MAARFILSLDCEGKWGVADLLNPETHRQLSDERLKDAYRAVLAALEEHDVAATFAFVGLFGESEAALARLEPELRDFAGRSPDYVGAALDDMRRGSRQGWSGDWAVDLVGASRVGHEIALHGVTHVPWPELDSRLLDAELALFERLESPVRSAHTFVYPRNEIAHVPALTKFGIHGYRLALQSRRRFVSLASEFNIFTPPDRNPAPSSDGLPQPIPAGRFLNWRKGLRRLVPEELSLLRARRMLAAAERREDVVHYWIHPENFASAPATLSLFRRTLRIVATLRDAGRCEVLTQSDYCSALASRKG